MALQDDAHFVDGVRVRNVARDPINPATEETLSTVSAPVVEYFGSVSGLAQTTTNELVAFVAAVAGRFHGFYVSGERTGYFQVLFDDQVKYTMRTGPGSPNSSLILSKGRLFEQGAAITLRVRNDGQGAADFEGGLLIG